MLFFIYYNNLKFNHIFFFKSCIVKKILAKASEKNNIQASSIAWVKIDILMTHDPYSAVIISILKKEFRNSAVAKNGIIIPSESIFQYIYKRSNIKNFEVMLIDKSAEYQKFEEYDFRNMQS